MTFSRRTMMISAGAVAVGAITAATSGDLFALEELTPAKVYAVDGVALGGTDPVSYFDEGAPRSGDPAITADWAGATWRFASAANRDRFLADPAAFAPQYGGFCAWGLAAKGGLFSTDPDAWRIVDGKLYLNYSKSVQRSWEKDVPGFIVEGDRRWPEVAGDG